jgi:VanZ family protein
MIARRRDSIIVPLFTRYWLPVLAYVAGIVLLSSMPNLQPPLPFEQSDKLYHVLEYLGLGWLLARAWRATAGAQRPLALALIAISCGIVVGAGDEYYQSFVPGRISSGYDLLADTAGLALAQIVYRALVRD